MNELSMNAGPTLPLPNADTKRIYDHLLDLIDEEAAELETALNQAPASAPSSLPEAEFTRYVQSRTVNHLTFDESPVRDLAPGGALGWNALEPVPGKIGKAVSLGPDKLTANGDRSRFERSDPFTVSFWIYTPEFFDEAHVLYNSNTRIQGYRGWDVVLDSNRVHVRLNHAHPLPIFGLARGPAPRKRNLDALRLELRRQ